MPFQKGNTYRFQKGHRSWLGKHHTEETKEKIRSKLGIQTGKNNRHYGKLKEDVGYKGLHRWIRMYLPKPEFCEICHIKSPRDCANITGKYSREFDDWHWLCRSCHKMLDYRLSRCTVI